MDITPIRLEPTICVTDIAKPFYCCYWSFYLRSSPFEFSMAPWFIRKGISL